MGREIEQIALSRGHEIVCIIDVNNRQDFDSGRSARLQRIYDRHSSLLRRLHVDDEPQREEEPQ